MGPISALLELLPTLASEPVVFGGAETLPSGLPRYGEIDATGRVFVDSSPDAVSAMDKLEAVDGVIS